MKWCPKGAILNTRELEISVSALIVAIESLDVLISSDHVVNPRFRTADTIRTEKIRKAQRKQFASQLNAIQKVLKKSRLA